MATLRGDARSIGMDASTGGEETGGVNHSRIALIVAQFALSWKRCARQRECWGHAMGYPAILVVMVPVMFLSFLAVLSLLACVAAWRHWRWLAGGAATLALLSFVLVACGVLPRLLLQRLQAPFAVHPALNWAPHNAIVLLTGDSIYIPHGKVEPSRGAYARITEAAVLYRACRQAQVGCKLLVSGGDPSRMETTLAASYGRVLRQLGVPEDDLILESRSNNTWQNAQFSRPLLAKLDAPKIWLVSSAWHLRRAVLYFDHFGITATPVRADYLRGQISVRPSASNIVLADLALHEYLGIARYHWYNAMGWNPPAMKPGA